MRTHYFLLALALVAGGVARGDDGAASRAFTLTVLPVLKAKCFGCHGDDAKGPKGGLDVRTRAGLLAGGDSGEPSVVPGKPAESPLVQAVAWEAGIEMPPKENDRLTAAQVEAVRRWVAAGAPWPDETEQKQHREAERAAAETADGVIVPTSGGLADEWTYRRYVPDDLWAYRPVRKPAVPAGVHPVDAFLDAQRQAAGYGPAPPADPLTLIRRATFDLTGLPPTPDEIKAFTTAIAADSEAAWADLIDRLLAGPRYGERWAQHWLDVARYADTGGMANDYERSNAWRYRDYVIRSFNADKRYDRFVIEQLAGDELADAPVQARGADVRKARFAGDYTPEESEWLVATGFLRMGPWDNAMVPAPEARQIYLDDVVNSVGVTFLSTAMRCCKCHDHKFDPIPTQDYYRLYAAFAGTQMAERPVPFHSAENRYGFTEGQTFVEKMLEFAKAEKAKLVEKRETAAKTWYAEHGLPYKPDAERKTDPDEKKPPRDVGLNHVEEGQLKVREQDVWIWTRALERYQPMAQSVYNGEDVNYQATAARKLRVKPPDKPNWQPVSVIYSGGALEAPGQMVTPGVLSGTALAVPGAGEVDPYRLPDSLDGRRLGLARWVADPRNPLATRSIVNRVWQHHFGHGLARNPNNFGVKGVKGAKPTHPELLDYLAADFVEGGWTLKRLHRLVMTSRVYRQADAHPRIDDLKAKDPDNKLLAYFPARHLSAEELRDAMLAVTGELNPATGGLPAMPEINMEVALQPRMIQFSLAPAYQPDATPAGRNRRTVYAYRVRGMADPFLELFNQPNPNDSCEARDAAPVPPQAFTLFNSDAATDRSTAFALRLQRDGGTTGEQIDRAFRLALGRPPRPAEAERLTKYVADMTAYHRKVEPKLAAYPTRITRSLVEEFSGKPFEYVEVLPRFEAYRADPKPADVGPETRALADACLLLFNANEFAYVR